MKVGEAVLACDRPRAWSAADPGCNRDRLRARVHAPSLPSSCHMHIGTLTRRFRATVVVMLAVAGLLWLGARGPVAHAADPGALAQQISAGQAPGFGPVGGGRRAITGGCDSSTPALPRLQRRIARIQSDLDAKRAELLRLRQELDAARARLARPDEL